MEGARPIIIVKKKGGHGGHHGGAWKVAYADFVTAMMALFIVLWLLNSSKKIQEAVGGYFRDPMGSAKNAGTNMTGAGVSLPISKDDMPKLKEDLEKRIQQMSNFDKLKHQIDITVTPEGLRIELIETEKGTFFNLGSSGPSDNGKQLLSLLANELGKLPNHVSIEGHTDAKPYIGKSGYSNWELSADRANAARRLMQQSGLGESQVSQVRGYADQMLRTPDDPLNASNRRISVIVQNLEAKPEDAAKSAGPAEDAAPASASPPREVAPKHE
ncbi:MAG TPA: flagellar motor protein MotB [Terriglobales bacterium]|nr:flagellar motor protein MotB [Terriglobales bacterium]